MSAEPEKFDCWAICEVMGHQAYAGRVTEQTIAGAAFVRIDTPAIGEIPAFSKLLGAGSIFAITPCDEEVALRAAASFHNRPFSHLTTIRVPERLPAPSEVRGAPWNEVRRAPWNDDDMGMGDGDEE